MNGKTRSPSTTQLGQPVVVSGRRRPLRWMSRRRLVMQSRWFFLSLLIGLVSGLGAIAFFTLSHELFELLMGDVAGMHPVTPRGESRDLTTVFDYAATSIDPLWCILLPTVGGLLVGLLVYTFEPDAQGHGTDRAIAAYHYGKGRIAPRVVWVKTLASTLTLATGGSGGREGPIAQIGAGFGSWVATRLRLSNRDRRILLAVGMGAGVSAIFRAPLAGALFTAEVLYRNADFESEVIMPSLMGCIVAYSVFTWPFGQGSLFATDQLAYAGDFVFHNPAELLCYGVLAFVLTGFVYLYVGGFTGIEALFRKLPIKPHVKPMIGGLLTGGLALLLYKMVDDGRVLNVLAFGYAAIQEPFDIDPSTLQDGIAWRLAGIFLLVAVGKILTTSFTIGSGGSAGVFGPSMVIGGTVGAAVGIVFNGIWPEVAPHPGAFTIVGMAGFFTGVARTPISTLLMVSEITGSYHLVVPAMGVGAATFALCRKVTIYDSQAASRRQSPAHRGEFLSDVLEGMSVRDLMERLRVPETIHGRTTLRELMALLPKGHSHYYPVLDDDEKLIGIISINDIRSYIHEEHAWDLLIGLDVMTTPVIAVTPSDDLSTAMRAFTRRNIDELPVVDPQDPGQLIGMLGRREVIASYNLRRDEE